MSVLRLLAVVAVAPFGLPSCTLFAQELPITQDGAANPDIVKTSALSEWEIKPRLRLQYDVANIDGPEGLVGQGSFNAIRRARLGFDIKMPNGFSARLDGEVNTDPIELLDAYVQWDSGRISIIAGQQKQLLSFDFQTSNLNNSFMERPAFVTAFNYGRGTGVSAGYEGHHFGVQAGVFTDPIVAFNDVHSNSVAFDSRVYFAPQLGAVQFHLAGSYHWRDLKDLSSEPTRYRQRPQVRITDTRYIGTPILFVDQERKYGLEAGAVWKRFHGAAEMHWLQASRPGLSDPRFFGGYSEIGLFLTNDSRPLNGGVFGAVKPSRPLGAGGFGAVQINFRYDYLDLNSKGVTGGKQDGYLASLIWTPVDLVKFMVNYARLNYSDAAIAVADDRNYSVDVVGARIQLSY